MAKFLPSRPSAFHDYVEYRNVRIPMRDGVELSTDIYFPAKDGVVDFSKKYPVIMNRTAYRFMGEYAVVPAQMNYFANEMGYVFINNSSRSTYLSEGGDFEPMVNEGWGEHKDGVDTMAWLLKQPWCSGKVATVGISWLGGTQYAMQLTGDVPGLETSCIQCPAMNSIDGGWVYTGEFLDQSCAAWWAIISTAGQCFYNHLPAETAAAVMADNEMLGNPFANPVALNMAELHLKYPLRDIPIARHAPFYQRWLDNRDNPEFFSYNDTRNRKHDMKKPLMFIGSWYDLFNLNALHGYEQSVKDAPTEDIAKAHRLVVGIWSHAYNPLVRVFPEANTDLRLMEMEWIQQQLNGIQSEFFQKNPVTLFVTGENRWRGEQSWPLQDAVPTPWYIHNTFGPANTLFGGGVLSTQKPGEETPDNYLADPANPVMSPGGHGVACGGQCDQRTVEMRPDVLVYTSAVLEEDVEVTGYVKATLYAATSATDTDFIMKLLDVCPDGNVYNIVTGGRRGRYLKNGRSNPAALTPGEINRYDIELRAASHVFKKGHQIRVDICSSDFLNTDLNPNAFIDISSATKEDYVVATQTVYHDAERPTMIELPIIPASYKRNWIDWPFHYSLTGVDSVKNGFGMPVPGAEPFNDPVIADAATLPTK